MQETSFNHEPPQCRLNPCWRKLWIFMLLSVATSAVSFAETLNDPGWPRVAVIAGITNTVYQPQLDAWDGQVLNAHAAVALQPEGAAQPIFGVISVNAATDVDKAQRVVQLREVQLTDARFPAAPEKKAAYLELLRSGAPQQVGTIALDRLEANLAALQQQQSAQGQPLQNDPPTLLVSQVPALLVALEGPPVYQAQANSSLQRVLNTRALLVKEPSGQFFLHLFDGYVTAPSLEGPWKAATILPHDLRAVEKKAVEMRAVDLLSGQPDPETKKMPSLQKSALPRLIVTTTPTELIVFAGEPQWIEIKDTGLLYVSNTAGNVFKHLKDLKNYILISGRWFRSASLQGPWEYVPGTGLPQDFANIPDSSPKENVKASVPGTRQAQEAVIANSVPQTAKVDRQKTQIAPLQYDGTPQLKPIDRTSLYYVVNSATPIIKVDATTFYACQGGVWFKASSLSGPWDIATAVPAVIYSIPPSSPLHYVTYVRVTSHNDAFVWVSYTGGYSGTIVSVDGVVVYGTGYRYTPWIGTVYIAAPVTYGYCASPTWTPWAGWAYGFAAGWAWGASYSYWSACPVAPYWGPYGYACYGSAYNAYGGVTAWGPYGWAGTSGTVYGQSGAWSTASRGAAGYNAWTGNRWATEYGRAYNSTTGARAVGQRGAVENVYTGNYASGQRGAAYNPNTGAAAVGGQVTVGNAYTGQSATAGRAAVYNPNTGHVTSVGGVQTEQGSVGHIGNDVYATKDGQVYRADGQGSWSQMQRPQSGASTSGSSTTSTRSTSRPSSASQGTVPGSQSASFQSSGPPAGLNGDFQARSRGEQRTRSFQANRPQLSGGGLSSHSGRSRRR